MLWWTVLTLQATQVSCAPSDSVAFGLGRMACSLSAASSAAGDRRVDKTKLRLVAFNAEWLFSENSTKAPWTPEQAVAHFAKVSEVIAKLKPDILSLEEVCLARVLVCARAVATFMPCAETNGSSIAPSGCRIALNAQLACTSACLPVCM